MEKHSKRLEYKVGIFVGLGLIAVMMSILLLGGNKLVFTRYANYKTQFSEVQGLFPGSVISLAGLPVGNVTDITFSTETNQLEVHYQVDAKYADRITEGTQAEIRTQGALGDKYIYLEPGSVGGAKLANGTTIPADASGDIFSMLTDKEDGIGNVVNVIKELQILLKTINSEGKIGKSINNISEATEQMKQTLSHLDGLITDIRGSQDNRQLEKAVRNLASVMEKIDKGQGTLGALINDPSLHQSLKAFLGSSPRNTYLKSVIRETIEKGESTQRNLMSPLTRNPDEAEAPPAK